MHRHHHHRRSVSVAVVPPAVEEQEIDVIEDDRFLVEMLQKMMDQLDHPYITLDKRYDDAAWVSGRLVELLPLDLTQKQQLLQMDDPGERLAVIRAILEWFMKIWTNQEVCDNAQRLPGPRSLVRAAWSVQ